MSAHRLPDDEHRDNSRSGRDDVLRLVRQRLSQTPRVVRLSGRVRRAVGATDLGASSAPAPGNGRD